jgi:hypothetical protein
MEERLSAQRRAAGRDDVAVGGDAKQKKELRMSERPKDGRM